MGTKVDRVNVLEQRMTEIGANVDKLTGLLLKMAQNQQQEKPAPVVQSAPTVDVDSMSHADVRKLAILHNVDVTARGKVAETTRTMLKSKLGNGQVTVQTVKAADQTIETRFGSVMSARERDGVQISAKDAAEALAVHPLKSAVLKVTGDEWRAIRSMGAEIRAKGVGTGEFRPNPANLSKRDRMTAHMLSLKPGKEAKEWTLYQGCLILAKLEAAGFKV